MPTKLRVFKPCVVEKAKAEPFPAQHVSIIVGKGQLTSFICASLSSLFAYVILCSPLYLHFNLIHPLIPPTDNLSNYVFSSGDGGLSLSSMV